ncbi:MAG: hypothetical protein PHR51_02870 [Patescibacteria group bacterium]|nr:hypothetical protein [Patescibacteria group bacterium]
MTKRQTKSKYTWARVGLYGFWAMLGLFAILVVAQYGYSIGGAQAATGGQPTTEFAAMVCSLYVNAGYLVGALSVLMIVAAGIVYAMSQGQTGGEATGIGLAKSMMIAALSGVALYVFGLVILGSPCGSNPTGGFIQDLLTQLGF